MNVRLPDGMGDFARLLVESIGTGIGDVSTVDGIGSGLTLAALVSVVAAIVAAWSSSLGVDDMAPILREDER